MREKSQEYGLSCKPISDCWLWLYGSLWLPRRLGNPGLAMSVKYAVPAVPRQTRQIAMWFRVGGMHGLKTWGCSD